MKIKDVPISKKSSMGSMETLGEIHYHYQKYDNIFKFFDILMKKDKNIKEVLCIPEAGQSWMRSFLKVILSAEKLKTSELMNKNVKPVDPEVSVDLFNKMIKKCKKRIIAISVQLIVENKPGTHANMLVIDTKKKTVELFEPHGKRSEDTTMDSLEGAYNISDKLLRKYFKKYFPEYKYISPQDYLPSYGFQAKVDAYSGLCVTWSTMYLHYRILNPNIDFKKVSDHMKKKVNKDFILKYAKYIEDTIKKKINNNDKKSPAKSKIHKKKTIKTRKTIKRKYTKQRK
jgi:hypothetical protein